MKVCLTERWEGRNCVISKNREWYYLHGETSLLKNVSWTLKLLGENRYFCLQSAEKENKVQGSVVHFLCGFWSGLLINVGAAQSCVATWDVSLTELGTELLFVHLPAPDLGYWRCFSSLLSAFQVGEKQTQWPSIVSPWGWHGEAASCMTILHPPRNPLPLEAPSEATSIP